MTTTRTDPAQAERLLVIAVVGPTATGKSDLALDLAEELGGECVNADSMQLYRGMDIGTAKLPPAERRGIRHHQLDVLDPIEDGTVAAYQEAARTDIAGIQDRGHHPIVVGGSGLYVRAALDRLEIPPTDPVVRARLEAEGDDRGIPALYARLEAADPVAAQGIHPSNGRRVIRALEAMELTGRPFSTTMPRRDHLQPTLMIGLEVDRAVLVDRIHRRVELMWERGLVEEVHGLQDHGIREGRTASRALGYAQALAQLDGLVDAGEAREQTAAATRRLARRQRSWFGPDPRILWLDAVDGGLTHRALAAAHAAIRDNEPHG